MTDAERRLDGLLDLIVVAHHNYARRAIPDIAGRLRVLVALAAGGQPELPLILQTFEHLAASLVSHLDKEEHLIFPHIRDLVQADAAKAPLPPGPFGTIANPLRLMEDEHQDVLRALDCLRSLTHDYRPRSPGLAGLADCYEALRRFDLDLRAHVFIEEHELYPRGLELEARLT
jgi:regulator of cell morphogenesis and NO signaling